MEINKLKKRYFGTTASSYDTKREVTQLWDKEQQVVSNYLNRCDLGINDKNFFSLLDIPVGTGRFFEFYKSLPCNVVGIDISEDMLLEAKKKASSFNVNAIFKVGDITSLEEKDNSSDVVVCIRILNLLDSSSIGSALSEICRVSNRYVLCGVIVKPKQAPMSFFRRVSLVLRMFIVDAREHIMGVGELTRYPEERILDKFEKEKFAVVDVTTLNQGRSGYAYKIFLLEKLNS